MPSEFFKLAKGLPTNAVINVPNETTLAPSNRGTSIPPAPAALLLVVEGSWLSVAGAPVVVRGTTTTTASNAYGSTTVTSSAVRGTTVTTSSFADHAVKNPRTVVVTREVNIPKERKFGPRNILDIRNNERMIEDTKKAKYE